MYFKYDCILGTPVVYYVLIILVEVNIMHSNYDCILGTPVCAMY